MKKIILPTMLIMLVGTSAGLASSSEWFETEGARIRLVTAGKPDAAGQLTGVLEIGLQRGWKTYWRDPGDAGVPPTVDVSASTNVTGAELAFPVPQLHDEGDFKWAGYDYPVSLPVTFTLAAPGSRTLIQADVFLGVCETICIPVKATLAVDPASDADNAVDAAVVAAGVAALPGPARPEFGVKAIGEPRTGAVRLEAVFAGDPATAELFIAGGEGYTFTAPVRSLENGKTIFTTKVDLPAEKPRGPGLHYTLATDAGAVSGLLPYF